MRFNLAIILLLAMAFYGEAHACVSFMIQGPVESLSKAGFQIEVKKDDSREGSFRFIFTMDKKLPWVAGRLYNENGQSTALAITELKSGNRTFSFSLEENKIATSKVNLSYGKKGDDGHYRGSETALDLDAIYKYLTQTKLHNKNSEPDGSR